MGRFDGKVAVVMPGTFGVGHEVARALALEGAKVAVFGVNDANGRATADALAALGAKTLYMRADSLNEREIEHACQTVRKQWGRIDIAICCNDHHAPALLHETSIHDFELTINFNTRAYFFLAKHTVPQMAEAGGGSVVFLSSMYSLVAGSVSAAYDASKAMANAFMRAIAERYGPQKVRLNAVAAGHVRARDRGLQPEFGSYLIANDAEAARLGQCYPAGRIAEMDEAVSAILFLASDESGFMTGTAMPVEGGFLLR